MEWKGEKIKETNKKKKKTPSGLFFAKTQNSARSALGWQAVWLAGSNERAKQKKTIG